MTAPRLPERLFHKIGCFFGWHDDGILETIMDGPHFPQQPGDEGKSWQVRVIRGCHWCKRPLPDEPAL